MQKEYHNLREGVWKWIAQVQGIKGKECVFPLVSFANLESMVSSQRRGKTSGSLFSPELAFFLSTYRHIIWRMSPMDEISIEACGKVTSKTHIYKHLKVDNISMLSWHWYVMKQRSHWWNVKFRWDGSGGEFPWRRLKAGSWSLNVQIPLWGYLGLAAEWPSMK